MKKSIKSLILLTAATAAGLLSSCDSMIYDDQGDCSVHYRVPFSYTMNILNADAFSSQVKSVTLYVFDSTGKLAFQKTESGDALSQPGYAMDVDLHPGSYSMLVWAEGQPCGTPATAFTIGGGDAPAAMTDLTATLPLKENGSDLYCDQDIKPLYYGYSANIDCPEKTYGTVTLPAIDLIKDTNVINVTLENLEGTEIATDALDVRIEAGNSRLDWENNLIGDVRFSYRPWSVTMLSSEKTDNSRADEADPVTGLFTELTIGRLMADRKPMLIVHRKRDNKDIIHLDLVKFLLMVKGHFPQNYTDQQYLDRMDRHTLTFFIDADLNWYMAGGININGWKVVPPQDQDL